MNDIQKEQQKEIDRRRKVVTRSNMNDIQKEQQKEIDRRRKVATRSNMNDIQKEQQKEIDRRHKVTTRSNLNISDSEKDRQKELLRSRMVTTRASMSLSQISNRRIIEADRFRTNHTNMTGTEIAHFRRLLNYRRKRKRDQENYIQRSTRRQRRHYTEMRGRKVGELNNLFVECIYCKALKLERLPGMTYSRGETKWFSMCCHKGKISVDLEQPTPLAESIHDLWDDTSTRGVVFRKYCRQLNMLLL